MERLNQWLAILANFGVLIGVFAVAYELRQNTIATEVVSQRHESAAQDMAFLATALDSSIIAVAMMKNDKGEELSELEMSQLVQRQHMNFRIFEAAYYQFERGILEDSQWRRYAQIIDFIMCVEKDRPALAMWDQMAWVPEFADAVERIKANCSD